MFHRDPILGQLGVPLLGRAARGGSAGSGSGGGGVVGRAQVREVTVRIGGVVGGAVASLVFEAGSGPEGREGKEDDDEGDDIGGEFGDVNEVLKD